MFRLRPADRLQLVLHEAPRPGPTAKAFAFDDPTKVLEWASRDRATVTFETTDVVKENLPAVTDLIRRWMRATA